MKICFFPHYSFSNSDGATLSMYNIIDELLERNIEVAVVLPNKNHLDKKLRDTRIDFIYVPMYSMRMTIDKLTAISKMKFGIKYLHNQTCVNKICKVLKDRGIDCIHINGLDSSVGAKVAMQLGIPYVWHIRAFIEEDLGKRLYRKNETYRLVRNANAVIGISKDIQREFEKDLNRSVKVIYNGIPREMYDVPDHKILQESTAKLLLAGRISQQKGQMIAIRAVEILKNKGFSNIVLTLIGQGETQDYLQMVKDYISAHHLEQLVLVLTHKDDLRELRMQNDIGLTCSCREAFGRVTVENMMAGLLVIGANSGGTPEIIKDGMNGFLYQVDSPQSLADVIERVLCHMDTAREVAQRGYQYAMNHYSIERVVDEITEIYNTIS